MFLLANGVHASHPDVILMNDLAANPGYCIVYTDACGAMVPGTSDFNVAGRGKPMAMRIKPR
jgi:hypothetical protein